jgi:hypothetical protein
MADEELRELEWAVAAGNDPEARLRYAVALGRAGRAPEAIQALAPLIERRDLLGQRARIHAAALYLAAGEGDTAATVLAHGGEFQEEARREYGLVARSLESLLEVPELWGYVARAIGKVAPLDDLVRVFRASPPGRTGRWAGRHILASAIQARDKTRAQELAQEEGDPEIARILRARGTIVL